MKSNNFSKALLTSALTLTMICCNTNKAPDVTQNVRQALDQAGFNNLNVSQDREKNVVTLRGMWAVTTIKRVLNLSQSLLPEPQW